MNMDVFLVVVSYILVNNDGRFVTFIMEALSSSEMSINIDHTTCQETAIIKGSPTGSWMVISGSGPLHSEVKNSS
jgi:hypothetical protein